MMMTVMPRGEIHGGKNYTGAADLRQENWRFGNPAVP
jgi:hypothetical protein